MKDFWSGFTKKAYDYAHESGALKEHYKERSKATPASKMRSGLVGAGIGGIGGAILGGMHGLESGSPWLGAAGGALAGAALGGGAGVLAAMADKLGIERAKEIMAMPPKEREEYLRHLARQNEISQSEYREWSRDLSRERRQDRRHEEMMGELRRR